MYMRTGSPKKQEHDSLTGGVKVLKNLDSGYIPSPKGVLKCSAETHWCSSIVNHNVMVQFSAKLKSVGDCFQRFEGLLNLKSPEVMSEFQSDMVVGRSSVHPAHTADLFAMGRSTSLKHETTLSVGHKPRQRSLATLSRKARTKRRSVQNLLAGFEVLRSRVPSYAPDGVHLTKKEILCAATAYIADLRALLRDADRTDACQRQCCHQPVCLHHTGVQNFGVPSRSSPDHYVSFSDESTSPSFVETRPYFHQLQPSSVKQIAPWPAPRGGRATSVCPHHDRGEGVCSFFSQIALQTGKKNRVVSKMTQPQSLNRLLSNEHL